MNSQSALSREYRDFEPNTSIMQEEDYETIILSLPGFRKDQLRVQLTPTRALKISGERHTGDNKWVRFEKEYPISANCDTAKMTAKFELKDGVGILYIRQPKLITPAVKEDEGKAENKSQSPEKKETEPRPPLPQTTEMNNASKHIDETKRGEKLEDDNDVAQKSQEEEDPRKGGVETEENGKIKKVDKFNNGELMKVRVKMATKVGRMMSIAVVVLSAIVLGIYVKNLIVPVEIHEN